MTRRRAENIDSGDRRQRIAGGEGGVDGRDRGVWSMYVMAAAAWRGVVAFDAPNPRCAEPSAASRPALSIEERVRCFQHLSLFEQSNKWNTPPPLAALLNCSAQSIISMRNKNELQIYSAAYTIGRMPFPLSWAKSEIRVVRPKISDTLLLHCCLAIYLNALHLRAQLATVTNTHQRHCSF